MKTKRPSVRPSIDTDPFHGRFETIRLGDRVVFVCGPGDSQHQYHPLRVGKVYGKLRGPWGRGLRIKCDDFTFDTAYSIRLMGERGIGTYLVTDRGLAR
jgi:hypothetical protein